MFWKKLLPLGKKLQFFPWPWKNDATKTWEYISFVNQFTSTDIGNMECAEWIITNNWNGVRTWRIPGKLSKSNKCNSNPDIGNTGFEEMSDWEKSNPLDPTEKQKLSLNIQATDKAVANNEIKTSPYKHLNPNQIEVADTGIFDGMIADKHVIDSAKCWKRWSKYWV